jgi:hypothetical protein
MREQGEVRGLGGCQGGRSTHTGSVGPGQLGGVETITTGAGAKRRRKKVTGIFGWAMRLGEVVRTTIIRAG